MARLVRRNIAHLSNDDRKRYVDAVVEADRRSWPGGVISYWDFQDLAHQTTHVHSEPGLDVPKFLLWHRELCNRYEQLLQEIDPGVALHYWDWTTDPRSSPDGAGGATDLTTPRLMGTMQGNVTGALEALHNRGNPMGSRNQTGRPQDPPRTLLRSAPPGPPRTRAGAPIPSDAAIIATGSGLPRARQWRAFRRQLEAVHGQIHVWFGPGNIGDPTGHDAFQDPFVFLLHSNVDRLYAMWQCQPGQEWRRDPALVYGDSAAATGDGGLTGNTLAPWDGSSGVHPFTPEGGLIEVKPYLHPSLVVPPRYDTLPAGRTDFAVWRPSEGNWFVESASGNGGVRQWGAAGDIPVPGDYDGDGVTDFAVWRPSEGTWHIINSRDGSERVAQWGATGDIPVPGDYDGDGVTDLAVWRPSEGTWHIINSRDGSERVAQWGATGDIPTPGDYDGDGVTDLAVWRPSEGTWYVINSRDGSESVRHLGAAGDIPTPGDYDGDGRTDLAVWRPGEANWFVETASGDGGVRQWGAAGDIPVPADYTA